MSYGVIRIGAALDFKTTQIRKSRQSHLPVIGDQAFYGGIRGHGGGMGAPFTAHLEMGRAETRPTSAETYGPETSSGPFGSRSSERYGSSSASWLCDFVLSPK